MTNPFLHSRKNIEHLRGFLREQNLLSDRPTNALLRAAEEMPDADIFEALNVRINMKLAAERESGISFAPDFGDSYTKAGAAHVGSSIPFGRDVYISPNNMIIVGRPRSGKSSLLSILIREFRAIGCQIVAMESERRELSGFNKEGFELVNAANGVWSFHGQPHVGDRISEVVSHNFGVYEASQELFMRGIERGQRRHGRRCITLNEHIAEIEEIQKEEPRWSRILPVASTLLSRLQHTVRTAKNGDILGGITSESLGTSDWIFELHDLTGAHIQNTFRDCTLFDSLARREKFGITEPKLIFIIEDGAAMFTTKSGSPLPSYLTRFLSTSAAHNIFLIVVLQSAENIQKELFHFIPTQILVRGVTSGTDSKYIQRIMGLNDKQGDVISNLNVGDAVLVQKNSPWPHPILFRVLKTEPVKTLPPDDYERALQESHRKLEPLIRKSTPHSDAYVPTEQEKEIISALYRMEGLANKSELGITLQTNYSDLVRHIHSLAKHDYLTIWDGVTLAAGRGKRSDVIEISNLGMKILGHSEKTPGFMHRKIVSICAGVLERARFIIRLNHSVGNKLVDLVAEDQACTRKIFIEVETRGHKQSLLLDLKMAEQGEVFIVTPNEREKTKAVAQIDKYAPSGKIRVLTVGQFLSEKFIK